MFIRNGMVMIMIIANDQKRNEAKIERQLPIGAAKGFLKTKTKNDNNNQLNATRQLQVCKRTKERIGK